MVEIERKFLVDHVNLPSCDTCNKIHKIRQGYLMESGLKVLRVRTSGNDAFLTYKSSDKSITRVEYELSIPIADAERLLGQCECVLEKTRLEYVVFGMTWEIDVFRGDNEGLIVAEIELESEDQTFAKPKWVTEEVTDDARYLNSNLIKNPYNIWGTSNG
jgi:adenylate cyclase